ncbi:MAG TPA: HAMP domain-containing sensor histidine kinase [Bacteroidales bacterium]|nr:HAMP domain-containing sensor histidine kinase [Bacteroidales bacterium]
MRHQRFDLFVYLAAIGFAGILITQAYWVYNGLLMRKGQFDRSIELVLRSVLVGLVDYQAAQKLKCIQKGEPCDDFDNDIQMAIPSALLDSMLKQEMSDLGLTGGYKYAVFNKFNKRFVAGNYSGFEDKIVNSNYRQSLKAVFAPGDYILAIYFSNVQTRVIRGFVLWVVLTAVFLIMLLFSFWSTVSLVRRQKRVSTIKADFINNMTHELKTPIASIGLAAEMLSKPAIVATPEKVSKYAAVVKSESARLQNLVDHVLMSAMLDEGKVRLNRQPGSMAKLVEDVEQYFGHRISELSGTLDVDIPAGLPSISFDRLHMTNVLINLIDNAIKYSRGAPEVRVSLRSTNGGIIIEVADKGIGIPPEEKELIFKNLYRSHTGNLHDVKGFGIGLFYVKKIVELHGGKVTVESEHGVGSVFKVYLPAVLNMDNYES